MSGTKVRAVRKARPRRFLLCGQENGELIYREQFLRNYSRKIYTRSDVEDIARTQNVYLDDEKLEVQ